MTVLLLLVLGFTTWQGLQQPGVMSRYSFSAEAVRLGRQWIRLLSPAFLHASWGHFFGNALTLYFFGRTLESAFGPGVMLGFFFLSVAGGHLVCLLLHRHSDYRAVGASGGALGLLFATILLAPGMKLMLFPLPIPIPAWVYAFGFLLYTVSALGNGGGISHEAHLGGLLSGVLLMLLYQPARVLLQPYLLAAILLVAGGALWYFHANPGRVPGFFSHHFRGILKQREYRKYIDTESRVDALLEKVVRDGIHSLSPKERRILEEASRRRGGGRG